MMAGAVVPGYLIFVSVSYRFGCFAEDALRQRSKIREQAQSRLPAGKGLRAVFHKIDPLSRDFVFKIVKEA